jgi:hypothetical protein
MKESQSIMSVLAYTEQRDCWATWRDVTPPAIPDRTLWPRVKRFEHQEPHQEFLSHSLSIPIFIHSLSAYNISRALLRTMHRLVVRQLRVQMCMAGQSTLLSITNLWPKVGTNFAKSGGRSVGIVRLRTVLLVHGCTKRQGFISLRPLEIFLKTIVFSDVKPCSLMDVYRLLEKSAASVFSGERENSCNNLRKVLLFCS